MKLFQIFKTKQAPEPIEQKGFFGDKNNAQNAYFQQLYAGVHGAVYLPDWALSIDRETLYSLYADKNKGNHAIFSVVNNLARATAEVMRYAELIDADEKEVKNHWTKELLNEPNDAQTMSEFIELWAVNLLVVGDAFNYGMESVLKTKGQKFTSMYVIPSHTVEIISGGLLAPIKEFRIKGKAVYNGGAPTLNPKNVMFCKLSNPSTDTFHGLSPLITVLKDAEIIDNGKKRTNGSIKNGGVGNVIFPQPDTGNLGLTEQQKDAFQKELNGKHHGNYNKLINVPIGVAKLGDTPADLSLLQASDASIQAICNVYGFPLDLLFGKSTFANMGEAKKMRYLLAIPYADYFLEKFSKWTGVTQEGLRWRINTDEIEALKPDPNMVVTSMSNAGTTINERRAYLGYPRIEKDLYNQITYPMNLSFGEDGAEYGKPTEETNNQNPK